MFVRGNVIDPGGGDVVVDVNDVTAIMAILYLGQTAPICVGAADVNDNGLLEPSDVTYLINFLAAMGPEPPPPFTAPGTDPTPGLTVPDKPDQRFAFKIGSGAGVPSNTGIEIPVTLSNADPISGLQMVIGYNGADSRCPDLLIQEMRTEEGTVLSEASAEYIIAEWDNAEGVAFVGALKDFVDPYSFDSGEDPNIPAGEDQLVATLVVAISACANMGPSEIGFVDGLALAFSNQNAHNLVMLGDSAVRPTLSETGVIDVRRGFIRGDSNKDDGVNIADPIFTLEYIFKGGAEPPCLDAADANNDTSLDISDPIWLLSYLFKGGPQPSEPFPQAGVDPSDDGSGSLGCASDG